MNSTVLTIGYSNHTFEHFVQLLKNNGVNAIADVRSSPYSRHNSVFTRKPLEEKLKENGINYVFLGEELGARSKDLSCYVGGRVQYRRLAQSALFKRGIERVLKGACKFRLALLCAEKEPLSCHRMLLVGRELDAMSVCVLHIHDDGRIETQIQAVDRLIRMLGLSERSLFQTNRDITSEAYALQEKKVAYVMLTSEEDGKEKETT